MSENPAYFSEYRYIDLSRDDRGVLTMRFHTRGGPFLWGFDQHEEVADCLLRVSRDRGNRVVILTGTGDVFLDAFEEALAPDDPRLSNVEFVSYHLEVGLRLIHNHLDVDVPMIGIINGPAGIHAELAVLCDVVLCSDDAYVADLAHFPGGIVPGDGVHFIWPELLGPNRGRSFLILGEKIYADEAKRLGIVAEVLPRGHLAGRAQEIAGQLAQHSDATLRHTRTTLIHKLRRLAAEFMPVGLHASFGATMADMAKRGS
jgi:enoyl-CoA hydratase/carnithine racemase